MQKVRHHYFRWTPRTAQITFWYVIVIPVVLGTFAYNTQVNNRPCDARRPMNKPD